MPTGGTGTPGLFNVNWIEAPIPPPEGSGAPAPEPVEAVPARRITSRP